MHLVKYSKRTIGLFCFNACSTRIVCPCNCVTIKKRFVFLSKLSQHANLIINKLFEISDKHEIESLTDVLGLNANRCSVNTAAWKVFTLSLSVSGYSDNQ